MVSGDSVDSKSGNVALTSADGSQKSGDVVVLSGSAVEESGSLTLGSGQSTSSSGGAISIAVGSGESGVERVDPCLSPSPPIDPVKVDRSVFSLNVRR